MGEFNSDGHYLYYCGQDSLRRNKYTPKSTKESEMQFSSVAQSCQTLCESMDCSTPGLPFTNSWSLLKRLPTESVMPPNHLILCHPLLLLASIFPASGSFQIGQLFVSGNQSIGFPASVSAFPMNIKEWFPLCWTGWISLQSQGHSIVFSNTTVQRH